MKTCRCCDENPPHPKLNGICLRCARPSSCVYGNDYTQCGNEITWLGFTDDGESVDVENWEPGEATSLYCEWCHEKNQKLKAFDALVELVEKEVEKAGWDLNLETIASTGTHYYEAISPSCDCPEMCCTVLKIRVGDHATAHCSEDLSYVVDGSESGDDHDLSKLCNYLKSYKTEHEYDCQENPDYKTGC